ncbi:molybdopterin-dependent oxidoreductase, partial [Desulfovibrio sp. OttesenSCG-928-I05]|nr:molybdopterin-dependent oxidoreductase [Desulfovibrio sp. OttesenSCG-928-I05]
VNGITRYVLCDPEKDSLADALRRMGLTGTKVGCGTGQCGACTVILEGRVTRACNRKMKRVPDGAAVETIEGLGTAENPHPLQQAFLTYAAVQCGFCSPGFIMSAKGLLDANPSPTRQEVRDWFTKNNNICRCTGYKPIVDAVMAAAEVLRGEKTMADITFTTPDDGHIYGTHVPKPDGLGSVLGQRDYGADISLKMSGSMLHLAPVLGRAHHAAIESVDITEAVRMPGVVSVITARDIPGTNRLLAVQGGVRSYNPEGLERPIICEDKVFRYGDVVAVVAARSREEARSAAAKVTVKLAPLPEIMSFMDAAAPGAQQIHAGLPNIYQEQPVLKGDDPRPLMKKAAAMVEGSFYSTREPHLTIEPDVVQAYLEEDGGICIQCKSQWLYGVKPALSLAFNLPPEKIHIISNPVGGSFGYSMSTANYALAAACAMVLGQPVSLVLSYEEHQHMTGKRSPVNSTMRLACDGDGKFVAMDYRAGIDHGAYSEMAGALCSKVARFFGAPYAIPNIRGLTQTAFTNNNFGIAYRAFGSPQAYLASEQIVDMLARKIGIDPFELRYRNVARPGDTSTTSVPYWVYPLEGMMDAFRPHYEAAVKRAKEESTPELRRGVGFACGGYHVGKTKDHAEVDLELNADGTVTVYNTWADVGQGADVGTLVHTHEALFPLGLSPDQIRMVRNDTALCPDTGSASGSRSHHCAGRATLDAARQLMDAMRKPDGSYRSWQEMQDEKIPTRYTGSYTEDLPDMDPDTGHGYGALNQNFVLFMAEVEVAAATGKTTVKHLTAMGDFGPIGSYQGVLGQLWGSLSHSVGYALSENYDDMKKHATLLGAGVPRCNDVPDDIRAFFVETPRENGPHGSTGCSEGCQSAGHAAILNAITDATGARIFTLPATPEKVKAAMEAVEQGKPCVQTPWDFGNALYERLEYLAANPVKQKA